MHRNTFARARAMFNGTQPFLPFTVELVNGVRLVARHPEAIILSDELALFTELDDQTEYFDASSVVRLVQYAIPPGAE